MEGLCGSVGLGIASQSVYMYGVHYGIDVIFWLPKPPENEKGLLRASF